MLQKTTANTVIGLLEKSINKSSKSKIFTDLATAKHYQAKYGGEITEIKQYEEMKTISKNPLDYNVDDTATVQIESVPTGEKIYILTQSVSADLHNGFIFIKELLFQHHGFLMYRSIETLTQNKIWVFTLKLVI